MKIYTRTGDDGATGLIGGARVAKNDPRIVAYGAVDELNAQLGACRAIGLPPAVDDLLRVLQHQMFAVGAELANPAAESTGAGGGARYVADEDVGRLERQIDRFEQDLAPLRNFILPGGAPAAAALHVARCVCRRAESHIVALGETAAVRPVLLRYVNRVSDLLFVLARWSNHHAGVPDTPWEKG